MEASSYISNMTVQDLVTFCEEHGKFPSEVYVMTSYWLVDGGDGMEIENEANVVKLEGNKIVISE